MGVPLATADQLEAARPPIQAGGVGLPLPSLAVIARTAALAPMPPTLHTQKFRDQLLPQDSADLFARL